ncbi:unnamed protein product [Rotaria sp. Silwood1]|nr:unnamed protein product [Rotaria sp. Silwood1]CAF1599619.1 unnamed protein product [Rotaria sp. Silwood1]CAF3494385.1 unnamed protein product [Rotaria sp. Silwood1]CAF3683526.1 unnamed protein product [Rotaria sp. Silwood1]CAF4653096.1 unnamed protein product [Rotaria sp. Silwood1]
MAVDNKDLTNIDFDHDWKCYCQQSNDKTDGKTIISMVNNINTDQCWSSIELPHIINTVNNDRRSCKWWYCKKFDWTSTNQTSKQQVYLNFIPSNHHDNNSTINATIWLNSIQIFSGSLTSLKNPIELSLKLLHNETKHDNILIICCTNVKLSLHAYLLIYGKVIYAVGQIIMDENNLNKYKDFDKKPNGGILDYKVSVDNGDGRIDVIFNPKRKSKTVPIPSSSLKDSSQSIIQDNQINEIKENMDDDLLVPRLAIVILIVGTRGDVQPFIALGQALRAIGHRVRLATHETFRSFVRGNGLEFYPLAGDPADLMSFMVKNAGIIPSLNSIIEGDVKKKRRSLANILASTWQACVADDDETNAPFIAEAIIANPPSFGHIHCAEKLQIPLHIMFTMPWSPTIAFPHPLSNIESSIGPKNKINLYSYDVIEMLTWTGMRDIVNDFRKKTLGLRELHTRQATNALIDERVPVTYCWSPSLVAKPDDWGTHINVSGFFFLNLGTTYTNPSKDLLEFLGINSDGNYNRRKLPPPIYIGFGSITGHDSRRILRIVIDALNETGYRALLSGLATDTDQLPSNVFKIGNVPHDWLFQYVSAVCHHGGAGTTAAGLRAGKPTIIVPFFGDQFFWGNVIEKSGAGPCPLPGKSISAKKLAEAFRFVHEPTTRTAAERIRDDILKENGCVEAIRAFHANLPLKHMHSDLEPTFAACYRLDKYNIQISRPVAQVLVAAGAIEESELRSHVTREWQFMHDNRMHILTHGIIEHSQKAISSMFIDTAEDLKRAVKNDDDSPAIRTLEGAGSVAKGFGLGIGHLTIGCLSLYGEMTDALDCVTSLYDPYSSPKTRQRPRVTDFKSGAKAAGLSLWNGWKDGVTGIVKQPRAGYERHGVLGGAAGSLIATVNIAVKPAVGTLSSITWLSRGTYASVRKAVETYRNEGRRISSKLFDPTSPIKYDGQYQENEDEEILAAVKIAAARSGFHPEVCQHILHEFEKIKLEREQKIVSSLKKKRSIADFFSNIK